jgi:hypothetical protein
VRPHHDEVGVHGRSPHQDAVERAIKFNGHVHVLGGAEVFANVPVQRVGQVILIGIFPERTNVHDVQ